MSEAAGCTRGTTLLLCAARLGPHGLAARMLRLVLFSVVFICFFSCASDNVRPIKVSSLMTNAEPARLEVPGPGFVAAAAEAEDGVFFGVKEERELPDYTGSGYIRFPSYNPASVAVDISVAEAGEYCLRLRCAVIPGSTDSARLRVDVDDEFVVAQRLPVKGVFVDLPANRPIFMDAGVHRIIIESLGGEWYLDKLALEPMTETLKAVIRPRTELVTRGASKAAQSVYRFLLDMAGKGILSGQQIYAQTHEITAIYELTGKYPAILGVDFIDASPSRVERGTRSFAAMEAVKYWKKGGLVSASWHWNAPTGLIDQGPDRMWYSGFYAKATTFDFEKALMYPGKADYKLLLRDIDAIAVELKKLADAGVPVLWRPLHEASGGWFWWGAKGPEPYIELYKLLFNRLTGVHGLRNLIWVWNGQDPRWYPGDDYVDIVSIDVYPPKHQHEALVEAFAQTQACSFEAKLVALSENGSLPNILKISEHKIPWSWYCTWNGSFVIDERTKQYSEEYTKAQVLQQFYAHPWLITRDELPLFISES
jgi:mannan endo-1,4-beta-mannosidase